MINWHFSDETGSPFWRRKLDVLDFNPLTDVTTFADLRLFPNIAGELRTAAVEDLIPRGYGSPAPIPYVFESGGTTGAPKRTIQMPDWFEQSIRWQVAELVDSGYDQGRGMLGIVPSGPHGVGHVAKHVSAALGSVFFSVDLDPRWAKKLVARGTNGEASAYVDHIIEQAAFILQSQDIGNIFTTPPIVQAMARSQEIVDLINNNVRFMLLGGAQLDPDTYFLLKELFPRTSITMAFGNTMTLSPAITRSAEPDDGVYVFNSRFPYVVFEVLDPATGEPVPYGQRGQVLVHHLSKVMFIPNNLERDSAVRVAGPAGQYGDAISAVQPVSSFEGETVIEGVY
ncbi:phenazine antibiotic biosynthesis protein [Mycolicibacterium llatzerense]